MENNDDKKSILNDTQDDGITREINLDELYDGAINNTVVIDPVTNDEVLLKEKKHNYTLVGVFFAVLILLVLYYINNKTDLINPSKEVEPNTTTVNEIVNTTTVAEVNQTGMLNCKYESKSDAESHNINFSLNYEDNKLINSIFNYTITSNTNTTSATIEDLKNQYESFYINNASSINNNITFEKYDTGFTFNVETDYTKNELGEITIEEGKTILYVKPSLEDSYNSLKEKYELNGFVCNLLNK